MVSRSLLFVVAVLTVGVPARAEEPKLDVSAWRHIPVLHNGRVMPLDTFARTAVEIICDRMNPTLEIDGKPRRFQPPELLLSWLTEPDRWEQVPFLIAEHDELRKDILDVPVTAPDGTHLRYVSPSDVADSPKLQETLEGIAEKRRAAAVSQEQAQLTGVEKKANELWDAFLLYRQITFNPQSEHAPRSRFLRVAADVLSTWGKLEDDLLVLRSKPEINDTIEQIDSALRTLATGAGRGRFALDKVEPSVIAATEGLQQLSAAGADLKTQSAKKGDVPGFDAKRMEAIRSLLNRLAASLRLLALQSKEMHIALYDDGDALRIVPALNAAALDRDRDTSDEAQPWLTLQTVLYGSPELLKDYPQPQVKAVRATFARLVAAYTHRDNTDRPKALAEAQDEFAAAVRALGEKTTTMRKTLPISNRDEDLLRYTAYPAVGATDVEVRYNQTDPFKWSWVISLTAFLAFCLAFGVARKPLFWVGVLVLTAGLAWTAYGFALRVMVTKWAPVTNMYETVVYVPFFVSLLGTWFLLLPITWPGLQRAWRLTAIPGSWESKPDPEAGFSSRQFGLLSLLLVVARLGLMVLALQILAFKPYSAGGRTIINLLPVVDEGGTLPNLNNLVVWLVGLCVLLPAVWYLPRVVVALCVGLFAVPKILYEQGSQLVDQVYIRKPFGLAATFAAFFGAFIAWYSPVLDKNFTPLQPVLRDNFWLTIHVLTIVSSYGAGMLAWGLGCLSLGYYLFGRYREREVLEPAQLAAGYRPAKRSGSTIEEVKPQGKLPPAECHTLAAFIYKTFQVAVLLLAAGTILGGLWADVSWGRFWGWDPKEVWALISLLTYLAILHGRYAGWFGDFGLAVGSVLGATAIVFSWYGVNFYLGVGLHSYGFGAGGQWQVATGVLANWGFAIAAAIRYHLETRGELADPDDAEPTDAESDVSEETTTV